MAMSRSVRSLPGFAEVGFSAGSVSGAGTDPARKLIWEGSRPETEPIRVPSLPLGQAGQVSARRAAACRASRR